MSQKSLYIRHPRESGGPVLKLSVGQERKQTDYLGYSINLAARLLEVERNISCLCHQSVKEIIGGAKAHGGAIKFEKVRRPLICPRGIDSEDLETLWVFDSSCGIKPKCNRMHV